jgi:hypothetical protein
MQKTALWRYNVKPFLLSILSLRIIRGQGGDVGKKEYEMVTI